MNTLQIIVIGGIVGVIAISQMGDAMIHRHSIDLDAEVQKRIYRREANAALWWRAIEGLAFIMMVVGVLKAIGLLKVQTAVQFGIPLMATGLSVYCCASILRSWHSSRVYNTEAAGTPAGTTARSAALLTTLAEVALAAGVCWYVFFHMNAPRTAPTPPAPPPVVMPSPGGHPQGGPAQGTGTAANKDWVDKDEALTLLGKGDDYLEYLVLNKSVRTQIVDGKRRYQRNDISSEKSAGLLNDEDMKQELKQLRESQGKDTVEE
jgi:hypothetical protein